mgnify:CR=1 FL=1
MPAETFSMFASQLNEASQCDVLFSATNTAYDKNLPEAVIKIRDFRLHSKMSTFPYSSTHSKGHFVDKTDIDNILAQNGGKITGLKIYFAETLDEYNKLMLDIVIVGTYDDGTSKYTDFGVPSDAPVVMAANDPIIAKNRPCPDQCGKTNCFNEG